MNLYATIPNLWEVVAVTKKGEIKFQSRERFETILDVLWAFRFGNAEYVYVRSIRSNGCVLSFEKEEEANAFFKRHWPNSSDFVWANRH